MYGGPGGSGRSHLLHAVATESKNALYFSGVNLPTDVAPASGSLLIIDDVEMLGAEAQITLFRLFNDALRMNYRLCSAAAAHRCICLCVKTYARASANV